MFVILLVLYLFRNTAGNIGTEIVNGTDAKEGEFPFAVSLRYFNSHFCGGSILNENYVLTAAHCLCDRSLNITHLSVQYGVLKITASNKSSVGVTKVICHRYIPEFYYIFDVALLKLEKSLPRDSFQSVTLASSTFTTGTTLDATVIGWGYNYTNGYVQDTLQKVDVIVYNDTVCRDTYGALINIYHHVCAGWPNNGRGSCQGDSGGPLLVNNVQVGIVSFGTGGNCGISNITNPKVLARVSTYVEWIRNQAGEILTSNISTAANVSVFIICLFTYITTVL